MLNSKNPLLALFYKKIQTLISHSFCTYVLDKDLKGERSSEFYETLFELEGVRNEEKGAFLEQNISLALLYNIKAISETS